MTHERELAMAERFESGDVNARDLKYLHQRLNARRKGRGRSGDVISRKRRE